MFYKTAEPMVKTSNQVHTTTDYFLFKPIDGNRNKNVLHLKRLKQSMEQNYLFTVIIVNENYEIIDGQHRFEIIRELELPLHYIVCKGYGLNEVHVLNQNSKNWQADDYLQGYCDLNYPEYIAFRNFCNKHKLNTSSAMLLLNSGNRSKNATQIFNSGKFVITDLQNAEKVAYMLNHIKPIYKGYSRSAFICAILKLSKNPNFEIIEFVTKLKLQPLALFDCVNVDQYVALIEEIYNYRRREKINLRYSK